MLTMLKTFIFGLLALLVPTLLVAESKADLKAASKASERTLAIIKPDAVAANHVGEIIARFEKGGLKVVGLKMTQLTQAQAQQFYAIHKEKPFFTDLVTFMSSGPIVAIVLEGDNAVAKNREIIGATNPKNAAPGTIRADFAKSTTENAVHGSDSVENAKTEIAFFFKSQNIFSE